jgi:hypothetical protein
MVLLDEQGNLSSRPRIYVDGFRRLYSYYSLVGTADFLRSPYNKIWNMA